MTAPHPDKPDSSKPTAPASQVGPWLSRIRRRTLWLVVGLGLTVTAVMSLTAIPAWPVVGVAVAALAFGVNNMAHRLSEPTCLTCGDSLRDAPRGEHGAICPKCGTISDRLA